MTVHGDSGTNRPDRFDRWMYMGGHANPLARLRDRVSVTRFSGGPLTHPSWATLEVRGHVSGHATAIPVVVADHRGERYLVAPTAGPQASWLHNLRSGGGRAILRLKLRRRVPVHLAEVDPSERAPIIHRYLARSPQPPTDLPVFRITRTDP